MNEKQEKYLKINPEDKLWKNGKRLVDKTFKIKNKIIKEEHTKCRTLH